GIARSAVNLWNTTEGIRILNVLLFSADQFTALEEFANVFCARHLSPVRANGVYALVKWFYTTVVCVEAERSDQVGEISQFMSVNQAPASVSSHKLRAVQQSQTFF